VGAAAYGRDAPKTWQARLAQYDVVCSWGIPNHATLERVRSIECPVFIAAGDGDPMILPHYSYLLAGLNPTVEREDLPGRRLRFPGSRSVQ
jgi:hypothetical protein